MIERKNNDSPKVLRLQNLIRGRIIQNSLSMNPSLMRERTIPRDIIIKRNLHLHSRGHEILHVSQLLQLVLVLDVLLVGDVHARTEAAEGCDSVAFAYAQDGCVNVGCACFESCVGVGDSTAYYIIILTFSINILY
jgi:hypothetical protein